MPGIDNFLQEFQPFDGGLGILRTIPKIRSRHFLIDNGDLALLGLQVKDTPLSRGVFP
jgi:hypothetical protein